MGYLFANATFSLVRGTTWHEDVTLVDQLSNLAVNLTGIVDLHLRVRQDYAVTPFLLELTTTASTLVITDAVNGKVGIRATTALTLQLPEAGDDIAVYPYDLVIQRTTGEYEPAFGGSLIVYPQVSRAWGTT